MPTYRHTTTFTALAALSFAAVAAGASCRGARARVVLPASARVPVQSPEQAFHAWKRAGVHGRTLVLFDRYPHFDTPYFEYTRGAPLSAGNFLEYAVFENVVRRVYLVVPEAGWDELERQPVLYRPFRDLPGAARAKYLHVPSGIPLVASTPSSLPRLREDVLVYVNPALFDPREAADVLARRGISSDLTVVLERGAPR